MSLLLSDVTVGDELPELAYDVTATTVVLGALATRDWRPMHHDYKFATERNGTQDIFLNTPNQAAWFERFLTDWTGPKGRLGQLRFRMLSSVFPEDRMVLTGTVTAVTTDDRLRLGRCRPGPEGRRPHVHHGPRPRRRAHQRGRQPLGPPRRHVAPLPTRVTPLEAIGGGFRPLLLPTRRG